MRIANSTQDRKWVIVLMAAFSAVSVQAGAIIASGTAHRGPSNLDSAFSVSGYRFTIGGSAGWNMLSGVCNPLAPCNAPGSYSFDDPLPGYYSGGNFMNPWDIAPTYFVCPGMCAEIDFTGELTLPDPGSSPPLTLVVTAPFTATGGVFVPGGGEVFAFQGYGTATFTLTDSAVTPGIYQFYSVTYDFMTPEPATVSLVGVALLVLGYNRRRALR